MSIRNKDGLRSWLATEIAKDRGKTIPVWEGVSRDTVVRVVKKDGSETGPYMVVNHTTLGAPRELLFGDPEQLHRWYERTRVVEHVRHVAATEIDLFGEPFGVERELDPLTRVKIIGFFWRG